MWDWFRRPLPSLRPHTDDIYRGTPRTVGWVRWMCSSIVLVWVGVAMTSFGYAVAIELPTYHSYELEMIEKLFRRNPDLDNPLMGVHLFPNAVEVTLETAFYGVVGLLFTAGIAFLAAVRNRHRVLSVVASVLFSGGCLFLASQLLENTYDCFRWRFILYGLGLSAVTLGLCIGGISALAVCLPFRIGPDQKPKQPPIEW